MTGLIKPRFLKEAFRSGSFFIFLGFRSLRFFRFLAFNCLGLILNVSLGSGF